jgi:hypothetical protein
MTLNKWFVGLIIGFILLLLTTSFIPKYMIFSKLASNNNIFFFSQSVRETSFSIQFKNLNLFYADKKVLSDVNAALKLIPLSLNLECKGKPSTFKIGLSKTYQMDFRDFSCLEGISKISGSLKVSDGFFGRLKLENINANGTKLEFLEIDFKDKVFDLKGSFNGIAFTGNGQVSFNKDNPLISKINGKASASSFNFVISGSLLDLKYNFQ